MVISPSQSLANSQCVLVTDHQFQFISISNPDDAKDRKKRRDARSHAVKHALEKKRKLQQKSSENFHTLSTKDYAQKFAKKRAFVRSFIAPPSTLSAGILDPFQSLAVDSSRLQAFLSSHKVRQAAEPVFSIVDEQAYQSFGEVFQSGLDDPALLNAVMLTFAFASTNGIIDRECLGYQSNAISCIRKRMNSPHLATSASTIGAILLLAGVEARLRMQSQVQLHMGAIHWLLDICRRQGIHLSRGIKRAIFWQDLNACVIAGSSRIVDHTTFAELQWRRDTFPPSYFRLPSGFQAIAELLSKEFLEVLEDIHALQRIRGTGRFPAHITKMVYIEKMACINHHQASIQSRLTGLMTNSPALECCRLAAYLCSSMLCCTVWCASIIPCNVSIQLLHKLQQSNERPLWDDHVDLRLWILYIGGAFAPTGMIRDGYIELLRCHTTSRLNGLSNSWPELLGLLKQFIWSDDAFSLPVKALWEEVSARID